MATPPKQSAFFIQDPFTEDVKGPLDARQLKEWFGRGGVDDWGVSKTPHGPWTSASKVKGLAQGPVNPAHNASSTPSSQPPAPTAAVPSVPASSSNAFDSSRQPRFNAVAELAYRFLRESLIGRAILGLAAFGLLTLLIVAFVGSGAHDTSRPSRALLGHWKFIAPNGDYVGDFYFRPGPGDHVTLTIVNNTDGWIGDKEYGLSSENRSTRYIELKQWFRRERDETSGQSGFGSGLKPIKHHFSEDMKTIYRTNYIMGEWLEGEVLKYIDARRGP